MNEEYSSFHKILCIDLNAYDKQSVLDTIKKLEKNDDVLLAEPNYHCYFASSTPNDYYTNSQWSYANASLYSA